MRNILLVSHYTETPGVMHKFLGYLIRKEFKPMIILNPLDPKSELSSIIKLGNKEVSYKLPWAAQYFLEGGVAAYKFKANFKIKTDFDLVVCFDPLSFINIYFFRKYFRAKKIAYYNVDFSLRRFNNNLLNKIYLAINRFAYKRCDYFLYLTEIFARNIDPMGKYSSKSFLLKHTFNTKIMVRSVEKIPNSLIYAGNLSKTADFNNLIKALELIKKDGIDFVFDIYGDGQQKEILMALIKKSPIGHFVDFKGVVSNEMLLKEILPRYTIGVCPYITKEDSHGVDHMFTGTDLTTKIVEYIGSGLPVITVKLYDAFDVIEENKFGFLVKTTEEWYISIKKLLMDSHSFVEYRNNALNFAKNYDEEKILTPIFNKILS